MLFHNSLADIADHERRCWWSCSRVAWNISFVIISIMLLCWR